MMTLIVTGWLTQYTRLLSSHPTQNMVDESLRTGSDRLLKLMLSPGHLWSLPSLIAGGTGRGEVTQLV